MKRLLFSVATLLWSFSLWAGPVTAEQARQKAVQFLQGNSPQGARRASPTKARQLKVAATGRDDSYYIFNVEDNGGFVVVSGEDATEEILGYSDGGNINPDNMPCGMKMLLDSYAEQIEYVRKNNIKARAATPRKARQAYHVDPGRLARFGQFEPYNGECPTGCPTGCVATAMAELMYAYQWPQKTTATIPAYTTKTNSYKRERIPEGTTIDWANILQQYNNGGDVKKKNEAAIANLMKMAGSSVGMDYDYREGSAFGFNVPHALKSFFGYSKDVYYKPHDCDNWEDLICDELQKGYPVLCRGTKSGGGGHAFLLEGYDEEGFFDINYGWAEVGKEEEEFLCHLRLFAVEGLEDEVNEYSYRMAVILNVTPQADSAEPDKPLHLYPTEIYCNNTVYWRSAEDRKFHNVEFSWYFLNELSLEDVVMDYGFVIKKDGVQQIGDVIPTGTVASVGYKSIINVKTSFGQDLTDGYYTIHFVSKANGQNEWVYADNFNDLYFEAIVSGNALTFCTEKNGYELEIENFNISTDGQFRKGKPINIEYSIKCKTGDYHGAVTTLACELEEDGSERYTPISIAEAHLEEGQTMLSTFTWVPTRSGTTELGIIDRAWETVGSTTITVLDANDMQDMLELTEVKLDNGNLETGIIDGTYLKGTLTMTNHDEVTKKERLEVRLLDAVTGISIKSYAMQVQIAPGQTVPYNFGFTNLLVGHSYKISVLYASGEKLHETAPLLCQDEDTGETIDGNEQLASYEYWFDDDYDHRVSVGLGNSRASVRENIDTDQLEDGVHRLHFRVLRNDGAYSAVNTTPFLKLTKQKKGHLDYWLDDERDNMQTIGLEDTEDEQELELNFTDDTRFARGNHRLNMQLAVSGTVMGTVYTQSMLKLDAGVPNKLEYWVDGDVSHPQLLSGKRAEGGPNGFIYDYDLNMSHLSPGFHILSMRAISESGGTLGAVLSRPVLKLSNAVADHLEYWFDGDMTNIYQLSGQRAEGGESGYIYDCDLDLSSLSQGLHRLSLRATSSDGTNKSTVVHSTVMKLSGGDVTTLEYWFDGNRNTVRTLTGRRAEGGSLAGIRGCIFTNELNLEGIAPGHHRLYYRGVSADGNAATAVSTASVVVSVEHSSHEPAALVAYTLTLDDETVVAEGTLDATGETMFTYVLDTEGLTETNHTLTATFWNSFGESITQESVFYAGVLVVTGDVNTDGSVDVGDVMAIINCMAGVGSIDPMVADVNGDGSVDVGDVMAVINKMAGL